MDTSQKLVILAGAARYDVSCSSSGSRRRNAGGGVGDTVSSGICHSFTEDGRCISLLKLLFSNACRYDCAYCVNRASNDVPRASFTVRELVDLTLNFYSRNYIEGLFLSSGVFKSPDYTMEQLIRVARELRTVHKFHGYIHLKCIPGASQALVQEAGLVSDRLSVNIELPSEPSLRRLAADKDYPSILRPMEAIRDGILENRDERKRFRSTPLFTPAGQSTQLIVGASPETDFDILHLARNLYDGQGLKRVYYSGFVPVNQEDSRLPVLPAPPLVRENRLYQADWLLRLYGFSLDEIICADAPTLDEKLDPKQSFALRHPELFPVDVNRADYEMLLRVPGIGIQSAKMIVSARRHGAIRHEHLRKIGVVLKRAEPFILCPGKPSESRLSPCSPDDLSENLSPPTDTSKTLLSPSPRERAGGRGKPGARSVSAAVPRSTAPRVIFLYDHSFEGLLTAVFETYARKITPTEIRRHAPLQQGLFDRTILIETSAEKAERVWRKLKDLTGEGGRHNLYRAFWADIEGVEMLIYEYIRQAVDGGPGIGTRYQSDCVLQLRQISRKVAGEAHRLQGLVRFERVAEDLFLALVEPKHDVLPLIRPHFERRYAGRQWVIYDTGRRYGLYHDTQKTLEVTLAGQTLLQAAPTASRDEETDYQQLWKQYFDAINIPERRNMKLHLRNLPRRYWKYLPEKG